jgi:lipopolysaccharide transport system ATP-binding protein
MKTPTIQPIRGEPERRATSGDVVIDVKNVTKKYRVFGHPGDRIKQALTFGRTRFHNEFTALQDVSFHINKGESVGIIGRNGSGKSTLLQLICGILKPTTGSVTVNGRISALLELGAGFNPEFTGRENVYFQCALMGINAGAVDERFEDIAAFAGIGEFIDQAVRTYSSGMYVRLAFSVAIHVKPDILVVDEALSVGDAAFQHKSMKKTRELIDAGTNLLLVSHDRSLITSTCSRCILIDNGRIIMDGLPSEVFNYYYASITKGGENIQQNRLDSGRTQVVSGTGEAEVESIRFLDDAGNEKDILEVGVPVRLEFLVRIHKPIPRLALAFVIRDQLGQSIFSTNTNNFGKTLTEVPEGAGFRFSFTFRASMGIGNYSISTFLLSANDRFSDNFETRELAYFFEIQNVSHPLFGGSVWLNPELDVQEL